MEQNFNSARSGGGNKPRASMTAKDKKKLKEKKRKFIQKIKKKLTNDEDIDEAEANEYAAQWFQMADFDGDGLIDLDEFKQFIEKIDESNSVDDQAKQE